MHRSDAAKEEKPPTFCPLDASPDKQEDAEHRRKKIPEATNRSAQKNLFWACEGVLQSHTSSQEEQKSQMSASVPHISPPRYVSNGTTVKGENDAFYVLSSFLINVNDR